MIKHDAAIDALLLARDIHEKMAGDEDADAWVERLLYLARGLSPRINGDDGTISGRRVAEIYFKLLVSDAESKRTKLRRLIDHPTTPQPEREAALAALARLK